MKGPDHTKTLWDLTQGHRFQYGAAIFAMALSNALLFVVPLVSRATIDLIVGGEGAESKAAEWLQRFADPANLGSFLAVSAAAIILFTALGGVFLYLRGRWAATASEAIVRDVRDRVYAHLERLPCSYHDRADTGDLVQRCTSDVETVRVFLSGQVVEIGRAILLLLTALPILWSLDPQLTFVAVALFPIIITFAVVFFRRIQALFLDADEAEGALTAVLQENLTGIRVVRAFARQDYEKDKFGAKNVEFRDKSNRLMRLLATYWSLSDLICFAQIGLVLMLGGAATLEGRISVGTLFAFLTYESMVIWPVRHMGRVLTETGKALVALERLGEVLQAPEEDVNDDVTITAEEAADLRGELTFENVSFSFGDEAVLRDISFTARPGETVAFVGPPGSGKSTIVNLLLRLYDYEAGSIRLDGRELREYDRRSVRRQIGSVLQEPFLYSKTIGDNLRVGRSGASLPEVHTVAQAADVHETIEGFEHGYDTLVGERGVTLSGGQRQRVAIARALLREPSFLVLDDSLSAVDTRTESRILDALGDRRGDCTTLVIAHRLSSVQHADRILVLGDGEIVQRGTHAELIRTPGPYRNLWEIQGALEAEIHAETEGSS